MTAPVEAILDQLAMLVGHDTQNPPRDLTTGSPLFRDLEAALPGFEITLADEGDGCLSWLAVRGAPKTLFNVHLDTVPIAPGWSVDPHTLTRGETRVTGLGACDIKGAAACLIEAAKVTDKPAAFLFSTDEEAGSSVAIKAFLARQPDFDHVVVAEPTRAKAVTQHRGIQTVEATFKGTSGHASALGTSAVHEASRLIASALDEDWAADFRLNFGRIEGGVKPNMIAGDCLIRFGMRLPPGESPAVKLARLEALAGEALDRFEPRFFGPALPESGEANLARQKDMQAWLTGQGIALGEPVDFWTEASLFGAAGYPVCVLGPGDIAQAHTADEWVEIDQLAQAFETYVRIIDNE